MGLLSLNTSGFAALLVAASLVAVDATASPCGLREALAELRVFTRTDRAALPEEVERAGRRLDEDFEFSSLDDGVYAFVSDSSGRSLYAPRVENLSVDPSTPGARYLVSHRSLHAELERQLGRSPRVVFSGEFVVRGGRVYAVTNASGTFTPSTASLHQSMEYLEDLGVPIEPTTRRIDASRDEALEIHARALQEAQHILRYRNSPLYPRAQRVLREYVRRFGNPDEAPGTVTVFETLGRRARAMGLRLEHDNALQMFAAQGIENTLFVLERKGLNLDTLIQGLEAALRSPAAQTP